MRLSIFRVLIASLTLLAPVVASAADVSLAWDPSPSSAVTGYILRYGTTPGAYAASVDVGNRTSFTVSNLPVGVRHYFVVQAYAGSPSLTSPVSEEVSWAIPITPTGTRRGGIDLNGDGLADAFVHNPATGVFVINYSSGTGDFNKGSVGGWAPIWKVHPAAFNGDARTDFLLYDPQSGSWCKALNNDPSFTYECGGWAAGFTIFIMDLNGDGLSDAFLYNEKTGTWVKATSSATGAPMVMGVTTCFCTPKQAALL
jgi:hypothetical protein